VRQKITRITATSSEIKKKRRTPPLPEVLEAEVFSSFYAIWKNRRMLEIQKQ